jgi:protein-tyrosine phosphatase
MSAALQIRDQLPLVGVPEGLSNFRDFGGHVTRSGQRIVSGRLYRSANLAGLTQSGITQFMALNIGCVVDLRGTDERQTAMPPFADASVAILSMPVEPRTSAPMRQLLATGNATRVQLRSLMIDSYRAYVTDAADTFGDAIAAIAAGDGRPALVHCTAGKDRTGFTVAVLQLALGASEDSVLTDYLRTNVDWDRASVVGHLPLDHDAVQAVLVADADYLAVALEEIQRRDGSVEAFVRRVTQGRLTDLHLQALLEDA